MTPKKGAEPVEEEVDDDLELIREISAFGEPEPEEDDDAPPADDVEPEQEPEEEESDEDLDDQDTDEEEDSGDEDSPWSSWVDGLDDADERRSQLEARFPDGPESAAFRRAAATGRVFEEDRVQSLESRLEEQARELEELRKTRAAGGGLTEDETQRALVSYRREIRQRIKNKALPTMTEQEINDLAYEAVVEERRQREEQSGESEDQELVRREAYLARVRRGYEDESTRLKVQFPVRDFIRFVESGGKDGPAVFREIIEDMGPQVAANPKAFIKLWRAYGGQPAGKSKVKVETSKDDADRAVKAAQVVKPIKSAGGGAKRAAKDTPGFVDGIPIEDAARDTWRELYHDLSTDPRYGQTGESNPHPAFVKNWRRAQKRRK